MAETYNPFAALSPVTPEGLGAVRSATFAEESKGQSFWAQEAGRAGLKARQRMLEQGVALNPEDERALTTQSIMQGAQKRLADLVKSGTVDPMVAQETVIREAMSGFMAAGDYNGAQSLLPSLNQIRTYRDEQAKLQSETLENLSTAGKDQSLGRQADARAKNIGERTPAQIAADEALAAQRNADARLKDRTDPNIRSGSGGSGGDEDDVKIGTAEQAEVRASFHGTKNALNLLSDLSTVMKVAPGAASIAGQAANTGGQFLAGVRNWLAGKGSVSPGEIENLTAEQNAIVDNAMRNGRAERARQAQTLGMTVTQYESLVVETAYALARVNDPGGRLSNNDFDYALRQLGAVQDPASAKAAFAAIAARASRSFKSRLAAYSPERKKKLEFDLLETQADEAYKGFEKTWGGGTLQDAAAPPDAPKLTAQEVKDGWQLTPSGAKVRVKK